MLPLAWKRVKSDQRPRIFVAAALPEERFLERHLLREKEWNQASINTFSLLRNFPRRRILENYLSREKEWNQASIQTFLLPQWTLNDDF